MGCRSRIDGRWGPAVALALIAVVARAGEGRIHVAVVDRDGAPVEDVAVYAVRPGTDDRPRPPAATRPTAVMDQRDRAFVPHVLVVRTGTEIEFPNSDSVSHHVYSFSKTLTFELPLYKNGDVHPPLIFDTPGVVTLGCNIHDSMVAYILVVDTPHFAVTGASGEALLDALPPGDYQLHAWSPRQRPSDEPPPRNVHVDAQRSVDVRLTLTGRLFPAQGGGRSSLSWSDY